MRIKRIDRVKFRQMTHEEELLWVIRDLSERHGIARQKDLASVLGVSGAYVCDLFNGRRRWNPPLLRRIAHTFGLKAQPAKRLQRLGAKASGWDIN